MVLSGTRAATIGGFTAVFAMANTMPVRDTAGVLEQVQSLGDAHGYATVHSIGAVTYPMFLSSDRPQILCWLIRWHV
eukprot:NODE_22793_length_694_cov_2.753086.p2 GENE.NODE_22793_length_694_cov_2.753086~~NODE_22793_length_694_cov_2.753086.p2  ORF type:complete len:77 (-),score=9.22 NODE_22793_length_694_cov_2.753086:82-312(-)